MKLTNLKHKAVVITAGVAALFATSCQDFLEGDILDGYSTELKTQAQFNALIGSLYGGYIWHQYESKFSWCVNEGVPGVLYNVYDKEGALFKLSIGDDNTILKEGYTSLYSGVIGTANQIIHKTQDILDGKTSYPAGVDEETVISFNAEARLFRAYAHFLATEYFGEVPLVWNTTKDITESVTLPLMSRGTIYKAVEVDLLKAIEGLPDLDPAKEVRATKTAAMAMLAKLYLTMASCQSKQVMGNQKPYFETDVQGKYGKVVAICDSIIAKYGSRLDSHANIFSASNRQLPSSETLFALYFTGGQYGEGSAYQSQMGRGAIWSPGSGWGDGKGLTFTLYNSFDESDARKKELCLYVGESGNTYYTVDGTPVMYGVAGFNEKDDKGATGKTFLSIGAGVLNNIKKMVWGLNGTRTHDTGMSIDRRVDIVRLSDIYFMRAEAKMALENLSVEAPVSAGMEDINFVLEKHGAPKLTASAIPFCVNMEVNSSESEEFSVTVPDGSIKSYTAKCGNKMYHKTKRIDLMQELRKEFAMEGHAWLDLKRLYYRDPIMAANFMIQIDRSCQLTQSPEVVDEAMWEKESGYKRKALVNDVNAQLAAEFPDGGYKVGTPEEVINYTEFFGRNQWFLPIPATSLSTLDTKVQDRVDEVERETYPY